MQWFADLAGPAFRRGTTLDMAINLTAGATIRRSTETGSPSKPRQNWIVRFMNWFDSGAITPPSELSQLNRIMMLQSQFVTGKSGTGIKDPIDLAR